MTRCRARMSSIVWSVVALDVDGIWGVGNGGVGKCWIAGPVAGAVRVGIGFVLALTSARACDCCAAVNVGFSSGSVATGRIP